jgi:Na+-driven multidrug efflux pump
MDMVNGQILSKVLMFSVPLMLTSVLQLLFNAADIVVVGRYAGSTALAAVGSTGALINLIVNVCVSLATPEPGAGILAVYDKVHTKK